MSTQNVYLPNGGLATSDWTEPGDNFEYGSQSRWVIIIPRFEGQLWINTQEGRIWYVGCVDN